MNQLDPPKQTESSYGLRPELAALKRRHDSLAQSIRRGDEHPSFDSDRPAWADEIVEFVADVRAAVQYARKHGNHRTIAWAASIANHWQIVMTRDAGVPMDVRSEMGIKPTDVFFSEQETFSTDELVRHLERRANRISVSRKLLQLLQRMKFYTLHPDHIHREFPSTKEECEGDWQQAQLFFALDLLQERISFSRIGLNEESLLHLDSIYLEDVVRLRAYLIWQQEKAGWAPNLAESFYHRAETEIHSLIVSAKPANHDLKARVSAFFRYRYLMDRRNGQYLEARTRRKAARLAEIVGDRDAVGNWLTAERQVKSFDLNIVPAIDENAAEYKSRVAESVLGRTNPINKRLATVVEALILSQVVCAADCPAE